jgi:hypothetical protein
LLSRTSRNSSSADVFPAPEVSAVAFFWLLRVSKILVFPFDSIRSNQFFPFVFPGCEFSGELMGGR